MNNNLPSDYRELQWIQSTGTQFIQLNYGFYKTDEIDFKFSEIYSGQIIDKYMVSASSWNTDNNRIAMGRHNEKYCIGYGNVSTGNSILEPSTIYLDEDPHIWHYKDYVFSVENPRLSRSFSGYPFGTESTNLKLFYGYSSNTKGSIYYWKHRKVIDGVLTLVEDLVPAKRISDNAIGMYDTVSNTFFGNNGTGTFIAGPYAETVYSVKKSCYYKLNLPSEYQELEYLQSTTRDCGIITSVTPTLDYSIEVKAIKELGYSLFGSGSNRFTFTGGSSNYGYVGSNTQLFVTCNNQSIPHLWKISNRTAYCDDNSSTETAGTQAPDLPIMLFARNVNGAVNDAGKHTIYYAKIWDNNNSIVGNYVPARRKSDSILGMYDTVTNTFFTNAGSGTFTAGPNVNNTTTVKKSCYIVNNDIKTIKQTKYYIGG